jgi:hypothetical protein
LKAPVVNQFGDFSSSPLKHVHSSPSANATALDIASNVESVTAIGTLTNVESVTAIGTLTNVESVTAIGTLTNVESVAAIGTLTNVEAVTAIGTLTNVESVTVEVGSKSIVDEKSELSVTVIPSPSASTSHHSPPSSFNTKKEEEEEETMEKLQIRSAESDKDTAIIPQPIAVDNAQLLSPKSSRSPSTFTGTSISFPLKMQHFEDDGFGWTRSESSGIKHGSTTSPAPATGDLMGSFGDLISSPISPKPVLNQSNDLWMAGKDVLCTGTVAAENGDVFHSMAVKADVEPLPTNLIEKNDIEESISSSTTQKTTSVKDTIFSSFAADVAESMDDALNQPNHIAHATPSLVSPVSSPPTQLPTTQNVEHQLQFQSTFSDDMNPSASSHNNKKHSDKSMSTCQPSNDNFGTFGVVDFGKQPHNDEFTIPPNNSVQHQNGDFGDFSKGSHVSGVVSVDNDFGDFGSSNVTANDGFGDFASTKNTNNLPNDDFSGFATTDDDFGGFSSSNQDDAFDDFESAAPTSFSPPKPSFPFTHITYEQYDAFLTNVSYLRFFIIERVLFYYLIPYNFDFLVRSTYIGG